MGLAAQLNNTTVLTPREQERKKTAQQKAEDIIYTLNHTITCLLATDLLIVPILRGLGVNIGHGLSMDEQKVAVTKTVQTTEAAKSPPKPDSKPKAGGLFSGLLSGERKEGLGRITHDPESCNDPTHGHYASAGRARTTTRSYTTQARKPFVQRVMAEIKHALSHYSWRHAGNWFVGEALGDVGGAVVTIPVQRFAPGLMSGIRRMLEPFAGGFLERGANRAAHKWADRHGLSYDHKDVVDRAQQTYEYEMRHLPQMAVWTLSSIGIHYGVMRRLEKISIGDFTRQKAATAGITAALVFGARALAPDKAHKWDETVGRRVVLPVTKKVGKLFGIEASDVDEYHARQQNADNAPQSWTNRVRESASGPVPETARSA